MYKNNYINGFREHDNDKRNKGVNITNETSDSKKERDKFKSWQNI